MPSLRCYDALCAGLPQAVSYRRCSQILGKGGYVSLSLEEEVHVLLLKTYHLPLPFFFFFVFLVDYPRASDFMPHCHDCDSSEFT